MILMLLKQVQLIWKRSTANMKQIVHYNSDRLII